MWVIWKNVSCSIGVVMCCLIVMNSVLSVVDVSSVLVVYGLLILCVLVWMILFVSNLSMSIVMIWLVGLNSWVCVVVEFCMWCCVSYSLSV